MAQALSCRTLTAEDRVRSQISPREICVRKSGSGAGYTHSTSVHPCQYHSANAPYPFIHLPPTLYNVSLLVLLFTPVTIIMLGWVGLG